MRSFEYSYGSHPLQKLDFYQSKCSSDLLLVFTHGGVWRTGDKAEHQQLFETLSCVGHVASINYRLSAFNDQGKPQCLHPAHEEDVTSAVEWLVGPTSPVSKADIRVVLVGHSAGVQLSLRALIRSEAVREHTAALIGLAGIYDLSTLVEEYPDYLSFTEQAFTQDRTKWPSTRESIQFLSGRHVFLVHSKGDGLLTLKQPETFRQWLQPQIPQLLSFATDYERINEQHDEMLDQSNVPNVILDFVLNALHTPDGA